MLSPLLAALLLLAPEPLPKGELILSRYVDLTGGRAAYEQVHGSLSKGTMTVSAQAIKGSMTVYETDHKKQVTIVEFPGIGRLEEGTDGVHAWSNSAMEGARLKEGEEKAVALRSASGEAKYLDWRKQYKSVETVAVENIDGKPAYKVVLTPIAGKPETEYYDKVSGLLIKQSTTVTMPMGDVAVTMNIGGYRKEGDILMPHSLQQTLAGQKIDIQVDTVEINPTFPPGRFDPPAEVKALIKP